MGLLGTSATFAPLVADTSQWFTRRRGMAVAICMSGNYLAGAIWPLGGRNEWRPAVPLSRCVIEGDEIPIAIDDLRRAAEPALGQHV